MEFYLIVVDVITITISLPSITSPFRPTSEPGLSVLCSGDLLSRSVSSEEANQKGNLWANGKISSDLLLNNLKFRYLESFHG